MKLIGSLTESEFRTQLVASSLAWRDQPPIIKLLEEHGVPVESMFTLNWTPDQMEDWYTILINGRHVVCLEVPKFSGFPRVVSVESKEVYAQCLRSTRTRIQFAVALELSRELASSPEGSSSAKGARDQ
jgi:hypothetical protein